MAPPETLTKARSLGQPPIALERSDEEPAPSDVASDLEGPDDDFSTTNASEVCVPMIRIIVSILLAMELTGCASKSHPLPKCDGYSRRPLNRSMWQWEGNKP